MLKATEAIGNDRHSKRLEQGRNILGLNGPDNAPSVSIGMEAFRIAGKIVGPVSLIEADAKQLDAVRRRIRRQGGSDSFKRIPKHQTDVTAAAIDKFNKDDTAPIVVETEPLGIMVNELDRR